MVTNVVQCQIRMDKECLSLKDGSTFVPLDSIDKINNLYCWYIDGCAHQNIYREYFDFCSEGESWTLDLRVMNPALLPTELPRHSSSFFQTGRKYNDFRTLYLLQPIFLGNNYESGALTKELSRYSYSFFSNPVQVLGFSKRGWIFKVLLTKPSLLS